MNLSNMSNDLINEPEHPAYAATNPVDTLTMDIPLFIRLLEYAKEDAKTDMDLHKITENALNLHVACLTMKNYDDIVMKSSFIKSYKIN